jgi:hypothetical protein
LSWFFDIFELKRGSLLINAILFSLLALGAYLFSFEFWMLILGFGLCFLSIGLLPKSSMVEVPDNYVIKKKSRKF